MSTKSINTHSLIWTTVLRLLTEGDEFNALTVSQFAGAPIDDVREVLHEMAQLGWLDHYYGTWRAGESAEDLLRMDRVTPKP